MNGKRSRWGSALATASVLLVLAGDGCSPEAAPTPIATAPEGTPELAAIPAAPAAEARPTSTKEREFRDRLVTTFTPRIEALAANPCVIEAVLEANRTNLASEQEILAKDRLWRQAKGADDPLIAPYLANPCAAVLAQAQRQNPGFAEGFAMDAKGCIVGESVKTSDYWQGDEAKWTESFHGGVGKVFVDEIQYDHSSQAYLVQISVPVRDPQGKTIGALTVGVLAKQDR